MAQPRPADLIVRELEPYLGPNTARTAVRTFAERSLGLRPEALDAAGARRLVEALRPMMRTLLGDSTARSIEVTVQEALR